MSDRKWLAFFGLNARAQKTLESRVALEVARRGAHFRRGMRSERVLARRELTAEEWDRLYSSVAMDERCEWRHSGVVLASLRAWAHSLEMHERQRTGTCVASVSHEVCRALSCARP